MNAPKAPDPWATSQAQYGQNVAAAQQQQQLSAIDQDTPYGKLIYSAIPWAPNRLKATTMLSPEMQKLVSKDIANAQSSADIAGALQQNAAAAASKPIDLGWGATEQHLADINKHTLDPHWTELAQQMEQKLYNQGVRPGSAAYDAAMRDFSAQRENAYEAAALQGHQTATTDITNAYLSPINAATAWRAGGQVAQPGIEKIQTPNAQAIQPAPYADLATQNYNAANQRYNATMGGLFGLGGDVLSMGASRLLR